MYFNCMFLQKKLYNYKLVMVYYNLNVRYFNAVCLFDR